MTRLQIALQRLGHYTAALDGHFGRRTELAVQAFQRQRLLVTSGLVDAQTWSALTPPARR